MVDGDRRRDGDAELSPTEVLRRMPALVVLERLPVPVLAVTDDGVILFVNPAFATMVGRSREVVGDMDFRDLFAEVTEGESAVSMVRSHADMVVQLWHADGTMVRAKMSKSALLRGNDPVALATFNDLTEQLWLAES